MKQISFEDKMHELDQDSYDQHMADMTLPKRGTCLVDEHIAIMDQAYFDELLDYSLSMPSGVFVGKRWKANLHVIPAWECTKCGNKYVGWEPSFCPDCKENTLKPYKRDPKWVMRSYEKHKDPGLVKNMQREIIVI